MPMNLINPIWLIRFSIWSVLVFWFGGDDLEFRDPGVLLFTLYEAIVFPLPEGEGLCRLSWSRQGL
jgi:hypothetical protein